MHLLCPSTGDWLPDDMRAAFAAAWAAGGLSLQRAASHQVTFKLHTAV